MESVCHNRFVFTQGMDTTYANLNNNTVMNNNTLPNTVMNNNSKVYQPFPMNKISTNPYQYQTSQQMTNPVILNQSSLVIPNQTNLVIPNQPQISKISGHNSALPSMDSAYNTLRRQVPTFPYEKRLSKIDTLQLTIAYINLLRDILSSSMEPLEYIQQSLKEEDNDDKLEWKTSDLTARLHWVDWGRIGEGGESWYDRRKNYQTLDLILCCIFLEKNK